MREGDRLWPDGTPGHENAWYFDLTQGRWWLYLNGKWRPGGWVEGMEPVTKTVKSSDFADEVYERQGGRCIIPACGAPWTDVAHIQPSGMGGRPSTYRPENLVGLCHACHDAFDGNRAWLTRTLMEGWAQHVWQQHGLRREPPTDPVAEARAMIEERYGPRTEGT